MAARLLSLLLMGATYQYTTAFRAYMDEIDMPDAPPEFLRKRVATTRQENSAPAFSSEKEDMSLVQSLTMTRLLTICYQGTDLTCFTRRP